MKVNVNRKPKMFMPGKPPKLSAKQNEILNKYLEEQIEETKYEFLIAVDATILYSLHKNFGFGKKRLSQFFKSFIDDYNNLVDNYEIEGNWVAAYKLKDELGVDIDELHREAGI